MKCSPDMTWFGTCWQSGSVGIELQLQLTISIPSTEDLRLSPFAYKSTENETQLQSH